LMVMLRTIDNVATFFSLLILFIFIFSILGMNLFGCKFCVKLENGDRMCERKNFDSLLWAIITVFQVIRAFFFSFSSNWTFLTCFWPFSRC
jgi:voltage-dependent calcium channel T type alpha-1G